MAISHITSDVVLFLSAVGFAIPGFLLLSRWQQFHRGVYALYFAICCVCACEISELFHMHLPLACTVPYVIFSLLPICLTFFILALANERSFKWNIKLWNQEMM